MATVASCTTRAASGSCLGQGGGGGGVARAPPRRGRPRSSRARIPCRRRRRPARPRSPSRAAAAPPRRGRSGAARARARRWRRGSCRPRRPPRGRRPPPRAGRCAPPGRGPTAAWRVRAPAAAAFWARASASSPLPSRARSARQRDRRERPVLVRGRRRLRGGRELGDAPRLLHDGQAAERLALGRARQLVARALVRVDGGVEVVRGLEEPAQLQGDVAGGGGHRRRLLEQLLGPRGVARRRLLLGLADEVLDGDRGLGRGLRLLLVLVLVLVCRPRTRTERRAARRAARQRGSWRPPGGNVRILGPGSRPRQWGWRGDQSQPSSAPFLKTARPSVHPMARAA